MNLRCCLLLVNIFIYVYCIAQISVTIPSSQALNINFGKGRTNPGPPLSTGYSDFSYTTGSCPEPGKYSIVNTTSCANGVKRDAGHIYFDVHPSDSDSGYMMLINYMASSVSKTVFRDTIRNLCSNNSYLIWAAIRNITNSKCFYPNLTFSIETLTGQIIQTFQTGNIGGPGDSAHPYFGFGGFDNKATFPSFYGGIFTIPNGINNIVIKILTNPTNALPCTATFAIDNILLNAVGPQITIGDSNGGWLFSTCSQVNNPLNVYGSPGTGYLNFSNSNFIKSNFDKPAFQWQQSIDSGYTWTDIAGETNLNLSRVFTTPDTFFLRLRSSENYNISNANCSVLSNVLQVNVDGPLKDYDITSNSPVCEDSDIVFNLSGGATYITTGPNNFYDNTAYPHVYHPVLADSGWYHSKIITQGGCFAIDSIFVKVIGPNATASIFPDSVCYGKAVQLQATGGKTYLWSPSTYLNNQNIANPVATPLTTTKYQVQATDNSGCSAFNTVTVHVRNSFLKAAFNGADILCPNDVALFTDSSIGKIKQWYWSFGNGETSLQKNPIAPHYNEGNNQTYPVQLIVTDSANCSDTSVRFIKVVNNCYIAVPSAFTPNGDGLNDYLYPLNAYKATHLLFRIYNRFGKLVFETKDWTKKWDGKLNSISQPQDTYVWILTYTDGNNEKVFLKGTTVLIR
jgi:gliding motility-associated-like protein